MKTRRFVIDNILIGSLLLLAIVAGVYFRVSVRDCGLERVKNVEDIKEGMVTLDYAMKDNQFAEGQIEKIIDEIHNSTIIAFVKPTGKLIQTDGSYGQEIIVEKVICGEKYIEEGKHGWIYNTYGLREREGEIVFMNCYLNIMNPEQEYLAFLEVSPLNPYQEEQVYILSNEILGYICVGRQETQTLEKDYSRIDFIELKEYEFFSASERITEKLNEARKVILEMYMY